MTQCSSIRRVPRFAAAATAAAAADQLLVAFEIAAEWLVARDRQKTANAEEPTPRRWRVVRPSPRPRGHVAGRTAARALI